MPIFLVRGVPEAVAAVRGPVILVANLLTEGRGMQGFTAAEEVRRLTETIDRPIDTVIVNTARPPEPILARYNAEHKEPLEAGHLQDGCETVFGEFWSGEIARHDRRRLAYAIWTVLGRLLS
jgi:2-phospho-L-lactate transferase/gluconeogenesis factor (CofD/UPF0052 family)